MLLKRLLQFALLAVLVMALGSTATADINVTNGANPQNIEISLTIPALTNIWWAEVGSGYSHDLNDQRILFNDTIQDGSTGGDWYSDVLIGAYGATDKASTDPWAEGYYESFDAALFWMESIVNTSMSLTSMGNLANGPAEIPTWYTVAFTNNANCTWNVDCGFIEGGTRHLDGIIPQGGGQGSYGDDANADYLMEIYGGAFYPNQYAFPMEDGAGNTVYSASFTAFAQGTILFHARALRDGLNDFHGTYTTNLQVQFF